MRITISEEDFEKYCEVFDRMKWQAKEYAPTVEEIQKEILPNNPSQGIAFSTKNPVKEYTKAQKEFLYDYYMERGKETEANKVWK